MPDFKRNNLADSYSPYLRQHADNPVWWQEWTEETIQHAIACQKPIFVSVGYSTCHWCHVMAHEAFSDVGVAVYLNDHFVSIKVDREQRPDIDQFLMDFLTRQSGSGGWPLNVFLKPDLKPIFALTYAPAQSRGAMKGFLEIAHTVFDYYQQHAENISIFEPTEQKPAIAVDDNLIGSLLANFDSDYGGFGAAMKFPPHTTLLFLLYVLSVDDTPEVRRMCQQTLDAMRRGGLNDHLQGGVFRYCTDRQWTIPHFEKMLYDQAMAMWCYSLGFRLFGQTACKTMAEKIICCLHESFYQDGLFITALDADTEHHEGATYLWSFDQLKKILNADEFEQFQNTYRIEERGNFEGKNHLIRKTDEALKQIEEKLLAIRQKRPQPQADTKILCGLNALAAVSLIQCARSLNQPALLQQADAIVRRLLEIFWDGQKLGHSYYDHRVQNQSFLFDAAAVLLSLTMLYEDDPKWQAEMDTIAAYLERFRESDRWIESRVNDFQPMPASWFDHPAPSSVSMAELAYARYCCLSGQSLPPIPYRQPFQSDFYNICAMLRNGLFHILTLKTPAAWADIPPNTVQVRGDTQSDCFNGKCTPI